MDRFELPPQSELQELFLQKYGTPEATGWAPRRRFRFGYYPPADVYEAMVTKLVFRGCNWIDIGGGRDIFPENSALARSLVSRCRLVVGVDPSENIEENTLVHERAKCLIEHYETDQQFDLATLRMVVEHVTEPTKLIEALGRLLRPGGVAAILTVDCLSPITLLSRWTPFCVHHPVKKIFWGGEREDTFPVQYKMNSRKVLTDAFEHQGFRESMFVYLNDLAAFSRLYYLNYIELATWQLLRRLALPYPENCLLAIYQKQPASNPID